MIFQWVDKLNESNSRKHKEAVIAQCLASAQLGDKIARRFLHYVRLTYNPWITFGVKQVPESESAAAQDDFTVFDDVTSSLISRALTGHAARDAIVDAMSTITAATWNKVCRPTLIKDLRCNVTEKTFNKILAGTEYEIPVFGAQLAEDGTEFPAYMTGRKHLNVKLDGVRVLAFVTEHKCVLYSRNGIPFENFEVIEQELLAQFWPRYQQHNPRSQGVVFDGEVVSRDFNDLMKHARVKGAKKGKAAPVYHVFDMIPVEDFDRGYYNASQATRTNHLGRVIPASYNSSTVKLVPHVEVDLDTAEGREVMDRFMADAIAQKFEGIMVKDVDAPYECKRSVSWLKVKPTITVDLVCIGYEIGTGRNRGRLGAFIFEGEDHGRSIRVNVGTGYSDKDREYFWEHREQFVGCIGEVEADKVSENKDGTFSLRFPRFVRWRGLTPGVKL